MNLKRASEAQLAEISMVYFFIRGLLGLIVTTSKSSQGKAR